MFVVIFEVHPKKDRFDDYLGLAKDLKPELERIDGFIDNERFESRRQPGHILSLSIWRDEKAVIRWRTLEAHHLIQKKGRSDIFDDYHLRVGEITNDSHLPAGHVIIEQRFDVTVVGSSESVSISEMNGSNDHRKNLNMQIIVGLPAIGSEGVIDQEIFGGITHAGKVLLLTSWKDASAANAWRFSRHDRLDIRHRQVRIISDYGMHDRREAPQFHHPL